MQQWVDTSIRKVHDSFDTLFRTQRSHKTERTKEQRHGIDGAAALRRLRFGAGNLFWKAFFTRSPLEQIAVGRRIHLSSPEAPGRSPALHAELKPFKRTLWSQRAALFTLRGIALASAVCALGALAGVILPVPPSWWLIWGLAITLVATGLITGLAQRVSYMEAALVMDRKLKLQDRLATAVELERDHRTEGLAELQVADAARRIVTLRPKSALRVPAPSLDLLTAGVSALIAAGSIALVSAGYTVPRYVQPFRQAVLQEMSHLQYTAAQSAAPDAAPAGQTSAGKTESQEMSQVFQQLQKDLQRDQTNPAQALNDLNNAESALRAQAAKDRSTQQALDQLAAALAQSSTTQDASNALKAGDTPAAGQQLGQLGSQLNDMRPDAKQELGSKLRQAAGQIAGQDPELAQALQQAANALQSGDDAAAKDALNKLGQMLSQDGNTADRAQALANALSQIESSKQKLAQASGQSSTSGATDSTQATQQPGQGQSSNGSASSSTTTGAGDSNGSSQGSTPQGEADQSANQSQPGPAPNSGERQWTGKDSQPLTAGQGQSVQVQGQSTGQKDQGIPSSEAPITSAPGKGDASTDSGNAAGQVKAAPDLNQVPLELRPLVRQYFNSLEGGKR